MLRTHTKTRTRLATVLFLAIVAFSGATSAPAQSVAVADFTFIHTSDVHAPMAQSRETIAGIKALGEIDLAPYGIKVPKPSFAVVSGDLNEFGGGSRWWDEYISYWRDSPFPAYHALGNHDNAWFSGIRGLRDLKQGPYYSFDHSGCHFVVLMTPTAQDPRPSIGEEQIAWLVDDLKKIGPTTPLFVAFHHPLLGSEFASAYDCERLLDVLHRYNTVLMMAGHSHGHVHQLVAGLDQTTGGSTFGPTVGFTVISVTGGTLRVTYWKAGDPAPGEKMLEKSIAPGPAYPAIEIASPKPLGVVSGALSISAKISDSPNVEKATYSIDAGDLKGDLTLVGQDPKWAAAENVDTSKLLPGSHCLKVDFELGKQHFSRSCEFFIEGASKPTAWRTYLAASSKVTPTISDGLVYVAANDGKLRVLNAKSGKQWWSVDTGAEILSQPAVSDGIVYTANGMGVVTAYAKLAKVLWSYTAGNAVYSSPGLADGKVMFGCNDGKLYALDAKTGKEAWINSDATYAIESAPFVANGKVYFGAWDQYVYCVDLKTGTLIWKQLGEGSKAASGAKRYYSPADAAPVVCEGKLFIADRAYMLTIFNADTGERINAMPKVAAVSLSEDGKFVYLRKTDGNLEKIDSSGQSIWTCPAMLGYIPTPPTEKSGVVYVCSGKGVVSAISADAGKLLWQYQASPQLFVMSSVACDGTNAYVTAFDGYLTAIKCGAK